MTFKKQKFSTNKDVEFFSVLRERVGLYFESAKLSRHGNWNMVVKTIVMFLLYFTPYFLLLFGNITHPVLFVLLWIIMGFGTAGIGLSVMHDANHGAYSSKKWINKYLGYSMNLIGANAELWKLQHNKLHHTYTNIEGGDDDINTPIILRFSPHRKRYWIHKYQYLYAWFFYGISTMSWFTSKDFIKVVQVSQNGIDKKQKRVPQNIHAIDFVEAVLLWIHTGFAAHLNSCASLVNIVVVCFYALYHGPYPEFDLPDCPRDASLRVSGGR